jgi:hypothetical protein
MRAYVYPGEGVIEEAVHVAVRGGCMISNCATAGRLIRQVAIVYMIHREQLHISKLEHRTVMNTYSTFPLPSVVRKSSSHVDHLNST